MPAALKLTELGYQPVGMSPLGWSPTLAPLSGITAMALMAPSVTHSCFSSGESVTLLGLAPLYAASMSGSAFEVARTGMLSRMAFVFVSMTSTVSDMSSATNRSDRSLLRVILFGWPATGIRAVTLGAGPTSATTTSRSRMLEM